MHDNLTGNKVVKKGKKQKGKNKKQKQNVFTNG
jgi:hypothetical protein